MGALTKRNLRRSFRMIQESNGFRVSHADGETLEQHMDALLTLWHNRWNMPGYYREGFRQVMRRRHAQGGLSLFVIWDGERPIGANAGFVERERGVFTGCVTASDHSYSSLSPGKTVFAYSIRHAIEQGCRVFDFNQGDQPYKLLFGAVVRHSPNFTLKRRTRLMALKEARDKVESLPGIGVLAKLTHLNKLGAKLKGAWSSPPQCPSPVDASGNVGMELEAESRSISDTGPAQASSTKPPRSGAGLRRLQSLNLLVSDRGLLCKRRTSRPPTPHTSMTVTTIRGLAQFDSLKVDWDAVYQTDTQTAVCMSWDWLRGWLEVTPHEWFVLALRPDGNSPYVAFLPLATASGYLFMGGTPLADYTGFVCRPEYEALALEA